MEWVIVFLVVMVFYVIGCNYWLCKKNEALRNELAQSNEDLCKLKLMNKLCHDWDGNLIKGVEYPDKA